MKFINFIPLAALHKVCTYRQPIRAKQQTGRQLLEWVEASPRTYSVQTVYPSVEYNTIRCGPKPDANTGGVCPKP